MEAPAKPDELCGCARQVVGTIRCLECRPDRLQCPECAVKAHQFLPFHVTQRWQHGHFMNVPLADLGLTYYLGHDGIWCPAATGSSLPVDAQLIKVAHINGFHAVRIGFCRCRHAPSHVAQLLGARLFPGSISKPRSAYTIALLTYFHTLTWEANMPLYDYAKALCRFTDGTSPHDVKVSPFGSARQHCDLGYTYSRSLVTIIFG